MGSLSKAIYVGIAGKARKITKIYIGTSSTARKAKGSYVGINDRARSCGGSIVVVTMYAESLTADKIDGTEPSYQCGGVLSYNKIACLAYQSSSGHGSGNTGGSYSAKIDAYTYNLSKSNRVDVGYSSNKIYDMEGALGNSYFIIAGGRYSTGYNTKDNSLAYVYAYNSSLVSNTIDNLKYTRAYPGVEYISSSDSFVVAGGGTSITKWSGSSGYNNALAVSYAESYNRSLTKNTTTPSANNVLYAPYSEGLYEYALFFGGFTLPGTSSNPYTISKYVTYINSSSTVNTAAYTARIQPGHCRVAQYAVLAGGYTEYNSFSKVVEAYDNSMVKRTLSSLNFATRGLIGWNKTNNTGYFFLGERHYDPSNSSEKSTDKYYNWHVYEYSPSLVKSFYANAFNSIRFGKPPFTVNVNDRILLPNVAKKLTLYTI